MTRLNDDMLDRLVRSSAAVADADLAPLADAPAANALFEAITSDRRSGNVPKRVPAGARGAFGWRRGLAIAVAVAAAIAIVAVPGAGVARSVASWLSGGHGPDFPQPTGKDVVLASGVSGAPWRIIATRSDQGLCVFVVIGDPTEGPSGSGGCGWGPEPFGPGNTNGSLHHVTFANWSGYDAALNRIVNWGWATKDVASVDLTLTTGEIVRAEMTDTPDGLDAAPRFFWAALPCPTASCGDQALVRELVARDAGGNLIERRDVSGSPKDETPSPR